MSVQSKNESEIKSGIWYNFLQTVSGGIWIAMKKLIEMQSFARSQFDQGRLFSFDQEVIDRPTTPLIHQEARFLYVKNGSGEISLQGKSYSLTSGSLVAILPWQVSDIIQVDSPLQYVLIAYHFDTVERIAKLSAGWTGSRCPSSR